MHNEIQTLLGVTTNDNSFWPYPHWYEQSSRYNGEWTAANGGVVWEETFADD